MAERAKTYAGGQAQFTASINWKTGRLDIKARNYPIQPFQSSELSKRIADFLETLCQEAANDQ